MATVKPKKYAVGVCYGDMRPFPTCCSAKNLASLGLRFTTGKGDGLGVTTQAVIPIKVTALDTAAMQRITRDLPAQLRAWPVRIWYSFLLQKLYDKRVNGEGGGDGYRTKTFIISDNVTGNRMYERGSGFALWCRFVPGVTVVRSGTYPGAHGGTCESYIITLRDVEKVKTYLRRSRDMLNARLDKLRNSPERKRRGSNLKRGRNRPAPGFDAARYW